MLNLVSSKEIIQLLWMGKFYNKMFESSKKIKKWGQAPTWGLAPIQNIYHQ